MDQEAAKLAEKQARGDSHGAQERVRLAAKALKALREQVAEQEVPPQPHFTAFHAISRHFTPFHWYLNGISR